MRSAAGQSDQWTNQSGLRGCETVRAGCGMAGGQLGDIWGDWDHLPSIVLRSLMLFWLSGTSRSIIRICAFWQLRV